MNHSTRVTRRPPPARPRPARTAAAIIATAGLALLAAACSGSLSSTGSAGPPNAGGAANSRSAVGYSRCMRSHGVPNFPDPDSSGQLPKADPQQLEVSSSRLQAAQRACQHLYPANGGALSASLQQCEETGDCPQAMVQQVLNGMRAFARCVRSRGVPDWPDPTTGSQGRPVFHLDNRLWRQERAYFPQIRTKIHACGHLMPGNGAIPFG
jgi:hypothetical protein